MKPLKPEKSPTYAYVQLWRVVDGAVRDCFAHHPEYIPVGVRERTLRNSIVKRVVGASLGYAVQTARGRSVAKTAAETAVSPNKKPSDAYGYAHRGGVISDTPPTLPAATGGEVI